MAENKQEPRQLKKPGHEDGWTDAQSEGRAGEKVRQRQDKLAVAKWQMGALCGTREVEGGKGSIKGTLQ